MQSNDTLVLNCLLRIIVAKKKKSMNKMIDWLKSFEKFYKDK